MIGDNASGFFPYTPATNLLYGLREAIAMLREEGLDRVFARHGRHAEATRRAVRAWGFELTRRNGDEYSSSLTPALGRVGHDAHDPRKLLPWRFDLPPRPGLGNLEGKNVRICP